MTVGTDTRKIEKNALFFALKGANFNANEFAQKAIDSGALYAIVDEEKYADGKKIFYTEDCLKTLQLLANHHRKQFSIPVLSITGSNAKTTHKELIAAVLSKKYNTLATSGNLNNHIGVPLTLLGLRKEHEFAIIEMGANHQGEIHDLCEIAEPDFGLITNIGKAHLEGFGGFEGVKKGKSEMYRFLKLKNAKVFVNGDDPILNELAKDNDKFTYGCKKLYDIIGKDLSNSETVKFKYVSRYGDMNWDNTLAIQTKITGTYNFVNCLAAAAIGHYFKVEESAIREALENYSPNMNRSQLIKTGKNTILLDAYNANPDSMRAAIENFSSYPGQNKFLLLGDMFELGEFSDREHKEIIQLLIHKKFTDVVLVGEEFHKMNNGSFKSFKNTQECLNFLNERKLTDSTVLIKGSRGMKMETLQSAL